MTKVAIALEEPTVLFRTISDDHLVVIKIIIITMMMKNKLDVCVPKSFIHILRCAFLLSVGFVMMSLLLFLFCENL